MQRGFDSYLLDMFGHLHKILYLRRVLFTTNILISLRARKPKITTRRRKLSLITCFATRFVSYIKNNTYGRHKNGRRVCWSKGRRGAQKQLLLQRVLHQVGGWCCLIKFTLVLRTQTGVGRYITSQKYNFNFFWLKKLSLFSCNLISPINENKNMSFATYCGCYANLSFISCLEFAPHLGSKIARAAGSKCCVLFTCYILPMWVFILLPSGAIKLISKYASCTKKSVNFSSKSYIHYPSAGVHTHMGRHPNVRGVAMNATDHPNGGKTHTLSCSKTPWGRIAKYT